MKKILLIILLFTGIRTFSQTPSLELLIFPKYVNGHGSGRPFGLPFVYRAKISGLKPNQTYRYYNRLTLNTDAPTLNSHIYAFPPANVNPSTPGWNGTDYFRPAPTTAGSTINGPSAADISRDYGLLKANAQGTYEGWFVQESVRKENPGSPIFVRISLNEPVDPGDPNTPYDVNAVAYRLHSPVDQPLSIVGFEPQPNTDPSKIMYGTGIRSTASLAQPKNLIFLYDNVNGEGRPIAGTVVEDDGIVSRVAGSGNGLTAFYFNNVNGVNGAWGTMIPNSDLNGVKRIEQRSLTDGSIVSFATSPDGNWADGANPGNNMSTANVQFGIGNDNTQSLVIDGTVVTLAPAKNAQTVAFTNTFPATFRVGDPDFTLTASSTAGLSAFTYTVAPAGILEITGNSVKVVGAGTAVITVTEPGNSTYEAASATRSITVEGAAQAITGLPTTFSQIYGEANLVLSATGGASGNPIVYTSDNTAIAEVVQGNQIVFKKAGTVVINANQAGNATYSPAPEVSTTLTITKAVLDVIAEDKRKTEGAANPPATYVYGAFKNNDDASSVTGAPVLTIQADQSSRPGNYDINVDVFGMSSEKYTLNPVKGTLTIQAKLAQVITFANFSNNANYGAQPLAFGISSTSTNEISFTSSNPGVAVVEKNAIGDWAVVVKGAGEADITASQAEDDIYGGGSATQHISIARAPLTVIAEDKAKLTGEADPEFTARYEGFVYNETAAVLGGTLMFSKQNDGADVLIVPSGLSSGNYDVTYVNGNLSEGNIAFANIYKVYGDADFNPGARSNLGTPVYTSADLSIAEINTLGIVKLRGAGTTTLTATYNTGETAVATLTVAQKAVTVTPNEASRIYAQADPIFSATYTGLVNGETDIVFTKKPDLSTTALVTSAVARYAILAGNAEARNYRFEYFPGVLNITPASLNVKADAVSRLYGQANPEFTLTYTGLAPFDNGPALNLQTQTVTTATPSSSVGDYPVQVTGAAATTNYTVTYADGSLAIQPAPLNIKANDLERPEGQPNPVFTFAYSGFVNGDQPESLSSAPVATTTAVQSSPKGLYPIRVSGASAQNYSITYTDGQLSIKGTQRIAFNAILAITYGDADFTPAATSETGQLPVFSSDNPNVALIENGRVKVISAGNANITATFPATSEFVAASATQALLINKRMLIVRPDAKSRIYGQANPVLTATYEGFVKGETLANAVAAPAILSTGATPLSPSGTYPINASAGSALNYALTYEPGVLTIDKALLTVTADNKTRTYGSVNPAFTFRYTGFVNAERESVLETPPTATTTATADSPAGTYPIIPGDAGAANYNFNYVNGTLTVVSTTRTLAMGPLPVKNVGDEDFVPEFTMSSGETPVFSSNNSAIATIVNNRIHLVGAGNVTIVATAPDNASYTAKPTVSQTLVVNRVSQTITFVSIPDLKTGTSFTLKATASSGLPVTLTVSDPTRASIDGNVLKGLRIGRVQVTASQKGDAKFAAAQFVIRDVLIADASGDIVKIHPALSLNGDGINDFLSIDGIKDYPLNKVTIINRNGIKVFDVEGYDNDQHVFAGRSKSGTMLPQGTYYALVEYNVDSKVVRKTGYFILKY